MIPVIEKMSIDEKLDVLEHLILGNAKELARDETSKLSKNTILEMKSFIRMFICQK